MPHDLMNAHKLLYLLRFTFAGCDLVVNLKYKSSTSKHQLCRMLSPASLTLHLDDNKYFHSFK